MKILNCSICKKEFNQKKGNQIYCSALCGADARVKKIKKMAVLVSESFKKNKKLINCPQCKKQLQATSRHKYCSLFCAADAAEDSRKKRLDILKAIRHSKIPKRTCIECRETFIPTRNQKNFCSLECTRFYHDQNIIAKRFFNSTAL
jgi:hypothetical protein